MVGAEDSCAGDEEVRGIVRSYEVPSDVAVGVAVIADDVSHDQLGPGGQVNGRVQPHVETDPPGRSICHTTKCPNLRDGWAAFRRYIKLRAKGMDSYLGAIRKIWMSERVL